MAAVAHATERFSGFSDEAIQFFLELQAEQSRNWFKAHQADFLRLWRQPLELFVTELQQRLVDVYPKLADAEPHYFRLQRDTRFARDKSPYKTSVAANLPVSELPAEVDAHAHGNPGVYVSFGLDGDTIAVGAWHMSPPVLQRFRARLDHPAHGPAIRHEIDALRAEGWSVASMETLKRVPPPFSAEHPNAELLKYKGLAVAASPEAEVCRSPELVDWAEGRLRRAAPVVHWLVDVLGG